MKIKFLPLLGLAFLTANTISCQRDGVHQEITKPVTMKAIKLGLNMNTFASTYHLVEGDTNATDKESTVSNLFVFYNVGNSIQFTELKKEDLEITPEKKLVAKKTINLPTNSEIIIIANISEEQAERFKSSQIFDIGTITGLEELGFSRSENDRLNATHINKAIVMAGITSIDNNLQDNATIDITLKRGLSKILLKTVESLVKNETVTIEGGALRNIQAEMRNFKTEIFTGNGFVSNFLHSPFVPIKLNKSTTKAKDTDAKVFYASENMIAPGTRKDLGVTHFLISADFIPSKITNFNKGKITTKDNEDLTTAKTFIYIRILSEGGGLKHLYFTNLQEAEEFVTGYNEMIKKELEIALEKGEMSKEQADAFKERVENSFIKTTYTDGKVYYKVYTNGVQNVANSIYGIVANVIYNITITKFEGLGRSQDKIEEEDRDGGDLNPDKNIKVSATVEDWQIHDQDNVLRP
ncbi:fimbria major subunit [Elizabethkingia anophelis]|uniref:fimbria major subunit n=1 Tax=Elizabethkingia anophelis TaxID=1117645 RepID=UPI00136E1880|nr:fimbria major subunit [Elizabethkingia anophelis]MYY27390.1 hypothetical protein [Elizabethkingia anophelis]